MVAQQLGRSSQIVGLEDRVARGRAFGDAVRDTEGLARQVGMSRTAFAARFRESVGEPPLSHLTRVRLSQGAGYLATTSLSIGAIARRVGYDNESSFAKAFKRMYRCSPGAFRTERSA